MWTTRRFEAPLTAWVGKGTTERSRGSSETASIHIYNSLVVVGNESECVRRR